MMKARIWFSITDYGVFSMTWNLVSDSSCDLRVSSFHSDSVRFETVPLRLLVGEREFLDNDQLSVPELLAAMAAEKSAASSACPSPSAFAKAFAAGDRTVCITISSQLSGTYHAACIAREMVLEEHPEKQIFVMDSRSASAGVALLVRRARQLMEEAGEDGDFEAVCRDLRAYHASLRLCFTLENFDIARNKIYSIDISFTGTGINEMTWRVEDGILKFYASFIYLFPMRSEILPGESTNINCAVFPQMTYNNKVSWESSDPSVCEVDQLGKITGISEGKATITATATDRNIVSESVEITVFPYAQEVEITESAEIFLNDTLRIKPSTRPLGSAEYIRWSSSDPDICSVDQNGLVKGINIGKAVITAFADDGSGLYDECEVSVSYAPLERIEILGPDYIIDKEFSTGEETYAEYSIRIHPANADPYYGLEWDLYEKGSDSHADAVARKTMQSDESGGGVFRLQAVPYQKGTTDRTRGTVTLKARYGSKSVSKDIRIYEYAPIDPQWNGSSLIDENFIENYGSMFRISFECDKLWQGYNFIGASATMFNFTSGFTMMDLAGQVYPKNANEAKALRKQLKITSGGGFEGEDNLYFEIVPE